MARTIARHCHHCVRGTDRKQLFRDDIWYVKGKVIVQLNPYNQIDVNDDCTEMALHTITGDRRIRLKRANITFATLDETSLPNGFAPFYEEQKNDGTTTPTSMSSRSTSTGAESGWPPG
jgi:hypothetical protein